MLGTKDKRPLKTIIFKFSDDSRPWPTYDDDELDIFSQAAAMNDYLRSPGYVITNIITGVRYIWASVQNAAEFR